MAVDNPEVIDFIGTERATGIIVLTISDHLEWDEKNEHLLVLQEKINRYIGFIESSELLEKYPDAAGKLIRIEICCKYAPTKIGERFLGKAREVIENAGWSFSWRTLNS